MRLTELLMHMTRKATSIILALLIIGFIVFAVITNM